ncbi:hypothetical protein UF75_3178 [Desulfosporosinus sp. I2]|nr:hypothetical protein UF75_3178 [Desulfosporosinus sp. I2]
MSPMSTTVGGSVIIKQSLMTSKLLILDIEQYKFTFWLM